MNTHTTNYQTLTESEVINYFNHSIVYLFSILFIVVLGLLTPSQAEAAKNCGKKGQYACKVTPLRLKACDFGLHRDKRTKRCVPNRKIIKVPPKQKNCGKLGQMACRITLTRPKACDFGLHRDRRTFKCVRNKSIIPPKQANCGKLGQMACKITLTRPKACDFGLVRDKRTKRCRKFKAIIPPKQKNCGKLNQIACKPTVARPKACDFGLHRDKNTRRCVRNKSILPPKQKNCGKLGQMACRITITRPKACNFGLHRDEKTYRCVKNKDIIRGDNKNCGKLNQRACKKWERVFACDKGLRKFPPTGKCVKKRKVNVREFIKTAKNVKNESISLIKIMAKGYSCFLLNPPAKAVIEEGLNLAQKKKSVIKEFKRAIENKDVDFALLLAQSKCIKQVVTQADREGYKTVTVGYSGGASFGVGGFTDNGFAFNVRKLNNFFKSPNSRKTPTPTFYQTKAISGGIQAGFSGGLSIGLYKGSNAADARGSDTHGVTFEAGAGIGGGSGIWFDYNGKLDGISASGIVGASGKAGAYNRINTSYYNLKGPTYISCGSNKQRACKKWERPKACNSGLFHNLTTGLCQQKKKKVLNCGGNGQRVCTVQEQVPGCNSGLRIDYKIKRCVYK